MTPGRCAKWLAVLSLAVLLAGCAGQPITPSDPEQDPWEAYNRKIHAFISEHVACGSAYTVFDFLGCRFGILICYDNNVAENVRITTLLGAEIVLMPHVTCCLPSSMPGPVSLTCIRTVG